MTNLPTFRQGLNIVMNTMCRTGTTISCTYWKMGLEKSGHSKFWHTKYENHSRNIWSYM